MIISHVNASIISCSPEIYILSDPLTETKRLLSLSDKTHVGLVPAIGGKGHVPATPSVTTLSDFVLPSPSVPSPPKPMFSPHVKNYDVDPESLLPGVIEDLISVAEAWKLDKNRHDEAPSDLQVPFNVLEVLKITTRAIRSTRNYLFSLPDEAPLRAQVQFRSRILGPMSREPSSSNAAPSTQGGGTTPDPISRIRRSALEVLTILRQLEENYRLPIDDEAYDAQSDGGHSRGAGTSYTPSNGNMDLPPDGDQSMCRSDFDTDMSVSFSLVQVQGQYKTVPVWEDEDDDFSLDLDEGKEKKDVWEDRLVLGTGWLYRQDVHLSDLESERSVVASYLDTVDEVLFKDASSPTDERGWERVRKQREGRARNPNRRVSAADGQSRGLGLGIGIPAVNGERRRVSTGMVNLMERMHLTDEPGEMDNIKEDVEGDEVVSDADLPEWARRTAFVDDEFGTLYLTFLNVEYEFLFFDFRSCSCTAHSGFALQSTTSAKTSRFEIRLSAKPLLRPAPLCRI